MVHAHMPITSIDAPQSIYPSLPHDPKIGQSRTTNPHMNPPIQQATFTFNFAEVYWNSRLQTEHARLIRRILDWKQASGEPIAVVCEHFLLFVFRCTAAARNQQ